MKFDIQLQNAAVGFAEIAKSGLYYTIHCTCYIPDKDIYKVQLSTNNQQINLGVCIPKAGCFQLEKRIPIKQIHLENAGFQLVKSSGNGINQIVAIDPNMPFPEAERIKSGRFFSQNGNAVIKLSE